MPRNYNSTRGKIRIVVTLVRVRITEKDASGRTWRKFVWGNNRKVRVTMTTENPKVIVIGRKAKKTLESCGEVDGLTWAAIEKIGGSGERLYTV